MAHVVTSPSSNAVEGNPEDAFVAALSKGHMQHFLGLAAIFGYCVEHYSDSPEASIAMNSAGNPCIARVVLQPAILFTGAKVPTDAAVLALHHAAHAECCLANSVNASVETAGVWHHEPRVESE